MSGTALVFPGQGSQAVGMGRDLVAAFPAARFVFEAADDLLGFGLSRLCFTAEAAGLQPTEIAQPALLTIGVALLAAVGEELGPVAAAGHSLGEYTALVAAGALRFPDALRLVRERGRLMADAGRRRPGVMAAVIGLDAEPLEDICQRARSAGVVVIANHNSPGQVVLSGEAAAVELAGKLARAAGARRVLPLPVSGAFHSPLIAAAAADFGAIVAETPIGDAAYPVVANSSARLLREADDIRRELQAQMTQPVRWVDSVRAMVSAGADRFVELGPGSVLAGLIRRIEPTVAVLAVGDAAGVKAARAALGETSLGSSSPAQPGARPGEVGKHPTEART